MSNPDIYSLSLLRTKTINQNNLKLKHFVQRIMFIDEQHMIAATINQY